MSIDTRQPAPPAPFAPARRKRTNGWATAIIVVGVVALLAFALFAALFGVVFFRAGSTATDTIESIADSDPGSDAVAINPSIIEESTTPIGAANSFARMWSAGDQDAMAAIASPDARQVALDNRQPNMLVAVVEPVAESGGELIVTADDGGSALLYAFELELGRDGVYRITSLTPGGDAG